MRFFGRTPADEEVDDDDADEYTLSDARRELAELRLDVEGLLRRESVRSARERQRNLRSGGSDSGSVEPGAPPVAHASPRVASGEAVEEGELSPAKRALWAQVRANRG